MINVPNVPGVPALTSYAPGSQPALLTVDAPGIANYSQSPQWGIFDSSGNPVIVGDNVKAFSYRGSSRIADFPIEQGAFASYNKVVVPFDARVVYTKAGSLADKNAFLNSIEAAKQSLEIYQLITPEITYQNANVTDYDYDRSALTGATLLTVEVRVREVRPASSPQFTSTQSSATPLTNTQSPSATSQVNGGTVQTTAPSAAELSQINANIGM